MKELGFGQAVAAQVGPGQVGSLGREETNARQAPGEKVGHEGDVAVEVAAKGIEPVLALRVRRLGGGDGKAVRQPQAKLALDIALPAGLVLGAVAVTMRFFSLGKSVTRGI
jgi:hypothetical protein